MFKTCLTRATLARFRSPPVVRLDPQVHPQRLPRDVQILRVLQRFAKHWADAFRGCALDITE